MRGHWRSHRAAVFLLHLLLASAAFAAATDEDDVRCLRGLKDSIGDPDGRLNWNFSNDTVGFVCSFNGVSCWNSQENRVISISLPSMSLTGGIPSSLQFCRAATTLDLSGNSFSGSIPPDLCEWLPFLVTLDLSGNALSGSIPSELSNCGFLNSLDLSSNSLSGKIPASLSRLDRLKRLDLSHNSLSGQVPPSLASTFPSSALFDFNDDLCGRPLSSHCGSRSRSLTHTGLIIVIAAGVLGAAVSLLIAYAVWRFCYSSGTKRKRLKSSDGASGKYGDEGRRWAERLRASHNRLMPVSLFQKPIVKVKLADLMLATSDFHPTHILASGSARFGTSYKAVLPDGSALTVKRLHGCALGDKQFRAEMSRIGHLRHPNLVPLLGFCVVEDERLLIYKHMARGNLTSLLRPPNALPTAVDWRTRLRIGIGAARGLAWLHHGFQIPFALQTFSSCSVLLDEDYEARITDIGLPRLFKSSPSNSSDSAAGKTRPLLSGDFVEFGYVPPEYASNPTATTKGDVYAFGVVLLELATGQKPTEGSADAPGNLVDWVSKLSFKGRLLDCLDISLRGKGDDEEMLEFLGIAKCCVSYNPKERPTMYHVYQSLKNTGSGRDFSEQFDEFPLVYGKDD
ncbi:putative inactive receptor kinase [Apostasia shenzhenica]|uniref:Putative inactive receptor kinase n=1 Tax=Apostasia shenzhenica TaxID=1088818 RepID=A0A2I0BEH1_9ASPA|nr:putative inactive receptor kinase [Apostasia shenzhenica]